MKGLKGMMMVVTSVKRYFGLRWLVPLAMGVVSLGAGYAAESSSLLEHHTLRRWGVDDGLAQGTVADLQQFNDGFLYVVTLRHVQRFDGHNFVSLDGSAPWLKKAGVLRKIARDGDGRLWLLAVNGAWRQQGADWIPVTCEGTAEISASNILTAGDGTPWLVLRDGVGVWDGAQFRLVAVPKEMKEQVIYKSVMAGNDGLLLHDSWSVWLFDGKTYTMLPRPSTLPKQRLGNMSARSRECYWVAMGEMVYAVTGANYVRLPNPSLGPGLIKDAADGSVWACTETGIQCFRDGSWKSLTHSSGQGGLDARSLIEGRDGIVWVGTSDGIVQFSPRSVRTFHVPSPSRKDAFSSVCVQPSGALWGAVSGAGLYAGAPESMQSYPVSGPFPGTPSVLMRTADGTGWIGTHGEHLWREKGGWAKQFTHGPGGVSSRGINALLEDSRHTLWVGSWDGLMRLEGDYLTPAQVPAQNRAIMTHLLDVVNCLLEDRAGRIWAGYQTCGLVCLTPDRRRERFLKQDGLPDDRVQALYEDNQGVLWIGTSAGLARWLALGSVKNMASVTLNGWDLGVAWCPPWQVRIPDGLLKERGNELVITVANYWNNRLLADYALPVPERLTQQGRNLGKHVAATGFQPSGLLGPVRVMRDGE